MAVFEIKDGVGIIPEGTIKIKDNAFRHCKELQSVTIPDSVTEIESCAFDGCIGLQSIIIPNSVKKIEKFAFSECTGLKDITIPNSVEDIGTGAFSGCKGLTSIVVAEGNKKYDSRGNCNAIIETDLNVLIAGCINTVIPNNVEAIGPYAFKGIGIHSIYVPYSVNKIDYGAFKLCTNLLNINIPDTLTHIDSWAFQGCTRLLSINIPRSVVTLDYGAFKDCKNLKSISILGKVKLLEEHNALDWDQFCIFDGCTNLETVVLGPYVKKIEAGVFEKCTSLKSIYVPVKMRDYYKAFLPEKLHSLIVELPEEKVCKEDKVSY